MAKRKVEEHGEHCSELCECLGQPEACRKIAYGKQPQPFMSKIILLIHT